MLNETVKAPASSQERSAWIKPELSRLRAGSAELLAAIVDDGPGDHS